MSENSLRLSLRVDEQRFPILPEGLQDSELEGVLTQYCQMIHAWIGASPSSCEPSIWISNRETPSPQWSHFNVSKMDANALRKLYQLLRAVETQCKTAGLSRFAGRFCTILTLDTSTTWEGKLWSVACRQIEALKMAQPFTVSGRARHHTVYRSFSAFCLVSERLQKGKKREKECKKRETGRDFLRAHGASYETQSTQTTLTFADITPEI
ncbi:hypothetical protein R3P38DRAFT_2793503 [Favolaschia claudopus]|uniref:Uncharacterized protein n=1 Tax=Favolaschia claudopus TaxID=2862362 RepID=A0AAW0AC76_9AGAR